MSPNPNRRRDDLKIEEALDTTLKHGFSLSEDSQNEVAESSITRTESSDDLNSSSSLIKQDISSRRDLPVHLNISKSIRLMQEPRLFSESELDERKIIYPEMSDRKIINVFRDIRTKLFQIARGQNFLSLIMPSCSMGGSTLFSLNLAASIAFDDSKTALLIDCNLRNPSLHKLLDIEPEYGLVDFLENEDLDIDEIIYSSGIPRLRVIPVGCRKESSGESFMSLRMKAFLDVLKARYPDRYIILDGPSIADSADARILAELCDLAVVVVPYGKSTPAEVVSAANAIGKDKLAGVVMSYVS